MISINNWYFRISDTGKITVPRTIQGTLHSGNAIEMGRFQQDKEESRNKSFKKKSE